MERVVYCGNVFCMSILFENERGEMDRRHVQKIVLKMDNVEIFTFMVFENRWKYRLSNHLNRMKVKMPALMISMTQKTSWNGNLAFLCLIRTCASMAPGQPHRSSHI